MGALLTRRATAALALLTAVIVAVSLPGLLGGAPRETPAPDTSSESQDPVSAIVPEPTTPTFLILLAASDAADAAGVSSSSMTAGEPPFS